MKKEQKAMLVGVGVSVAVVYIFINGGVVKTIQAIKEGVKQVTRKPQPPKQPVALPTEILIPVDAPDPVNISFESSSKL